MSSRVRLLPAVIGAAGVLLLLRIGAMASSADTAPATGHGAEATASADPTEAPMSPSASEQPEADQAPAHSEPTMASLPSDMAQTKGEAEVLQHLKRRREELDARERDIAMREQLMSATEKRVGDRLTELKDLETKLNGLLAQRDANEEAQMTALVKTYEAMKPTDAARLFNRLDRRILLDVASRMKPAKIGAVMAAMEAGRAQDLTVLLATRMSVQSKSLAQPAAAPAPTPTPVAPAPAASEGTPTPAPQG
jgi:flagellar motility protein MotE (MotC chaperone)